MTPAAENALYPHVAIWLANHLQDRFPRANVISHDTHKTQLSSFLRSQGLHKFIRGYDAFEIQVDVTGIVRTRDFVRLAFVECKVGPINLRDVGQLLGYSLIAHPEWSLLLSPAGVSDRLNALLLTYGRQDVLVYGENRAVRLATWNVARGEIEPASLIPRGSHI